jgi:hypothetical protein
MSALAAIAEVGTEADVLQPGLDIEPDMAQDEWLDWGLDLVKGARESAFALGDWAKHGSKHLELSYDEMEARLGHRVSAKRLKDCAWVCNKIERSRRQDLSFEHHQLVAGLKSADQDRWLAKAEKKSWKTADLKHELSEWRKQKAGNNVSATKVSISVPQECVTAAGKANQMIPDWIKAMVTRALELDSESGETS